MLTVINLFNIIDTNEVTPFSLFIHSVIHSIASKRTNDEFVVLNSTSKMIVHYLPNVKSHLIEPPRKTALSAFRYQRFVLPSLVSNMKPDLLIEANSVSFRTKMVPQIVLLDEKKAYNSRKVFHKLLFPVSLKYASKVASFTENTQNEWTVKYPEYAYRSMQLHYAASNHFFVHDDSEIQKIKDGYTDSRPYFIWFCDETNAALWEEVLKAFSMFKKWQQSNMKLVIIGYSNTHTIQLKLKNYKHKDDVLIVNNPDEHISSRLLAASYAMIYPAKLSYIPLPVLQAINCQTPCIVNKTIADTASNNHAFYWMEESEHQSISKQMILCYKNEEFRKEVIENAKSVGKNYSYNNLLEQFERMMNEVVIKN